MRAIAIALLFTSVSLPAQERLLQPGDVPARATAAAALASALASLRTAGGETGGPLLLAALAKAQECLPVGSAARAALDEILQRPADPKSMAPAVADLVDDIAFQPVQEAALPEGVPGFQALDELELRTYPSYRMVQTDMRGGTMGAFWPLFNHIKSNDIAMTTPVQIDYRTDGEREREASMAFLYGSPDLGQVGRHGRVEVVDMPPTTVLTIGSRGWDRLSRVAEMKARLTDWLTKSSEWEAAGPMRTMGYNSPSVNGDRRYFEVQVPVRPRPASARRTSV